MRLVLASIPILIAIPAIAAPIGPPVPVVSRTTPAQQSIALYRDQYRHGFRPCPLPTHANEVVVCGNGRGGSANRIPLPDERTPPDWARRAVGEVPSAADALASAEQPCRAANCPAHGGMDLIAAGFGVMQVARAVVDPEGASDHADRHPWKPAQ
jgi:hypothetical protein